MSGLDNLKTRIKYYGATTEDRMRTDKLRGLRTALFNSDQAETIVLNDGREFKCLINPSKINKDEDIKLLSIPFKDICLNSDRKGKTSEGIEEIGIKNGDVIQWKENQSYWLVYLQNLEEEAYFRGTLRRCRYELTIGENTYKIYFCGPSVKTMDWNSENQIIWNGLNYDAMLTITQNEETLKFFNRFTKVKINNENWIVEATDKISTEGIIDVYLKEDYSNTIEDEKEITPIDPVEPDIDAIYIDGDVSVYPYDVKQYIIVNSEKGFWSIDNIKKAKILSQSSSNCEIEILGNKGEFNLIYSADGQDNIILLIKILPI